ncbi:MAG: two-component system, NtrC family, C4-dicarboxylate transport sensor histidine kinase DctB [Gaiellales bacterium]|nr:two-component system, NtrC family, C4-dicarboxylate transport sensor histidine kinase DctB [Gaiellales bacterium]
MHGSDAAIPASDDAWDARADSSFRDALPVILSEVLAEQRLDALLAAVCDGGEELIDDLELTVQGLDHRLLAKRIFNGRGPAAEASDGTIAMLDLRPGRVEVRIPLTHAGVGLCDLVATRPSNGWIAAQERGQLRLYADLVAPLVFALLEAEELRRAALTDQLTGLANRRALDHELAQLCGEGTHLWLLLLDVDGLKDVNDALGYDKGDHLIGTLARTITESVKRRHLAARMGGDEFIVILPDATEKQARKLAKRITKRFARQPLHPRVAEISGGVSVGVIEARAGESPRDLVRRAARSMHGNKRRRRTDRRTDA